jgi:hypothetical protein
MDGILNSDNRLGLEEIFKCLNQTKIDKNEI